MKCILRLITCIKTTCANAIKSRYDKILHHLALMYFFLPNLALIKMMHNEQQRRGVATKKKGIESQLHTALIFVTIAKHKSTPLFK